MTINLCLSGGAARGAFHLGVLHYLEQNNIRINTYSGSSIGAVISVAHSSGISAKEQLKLFKSNKIKEALKFNYFKKGLLRIDHNHSILKEVLPINNLESLPKKVYVNAYDTKRKKIHYFDKGDTHTLCMASSALVPLFKPIKYNSMNLIDGGLIDNIPISPLKKYEEPILAVDLMPSKERTSKSRFNPIKALKRRVLSKCIHNAKLSKEQTDYYLTSQQLNHFKLFTFKGFDECFELGFHETQHFFETK